MYFNLLATLIILICIAISLFGNLAGFGGGVFVVPILVAFFNYPFSTAVGATVFSLVIASLISTYFNKKEGSIDFKTGIVLEIPTMIGAVLGSLLLDYVPLVPIEIIFAVLLFLLSYSFLKSKKNYTSSTGKETGTLKKLNALPPVIHIYNKELNVHYNIGLWLATFFGLLSGSLAGLFGVGGGFMKTPIMIKVFKIPVKIATSTAMFMIVITSITSAISHYTQGHIIIVYTWPVVMGFIIGALLSGLI
ncbi:MAG: sulfite exporter TauE/SafE family protein, partial [Ginsengibacter sp.]